MSTAHQAAFAALMEPGETPVWAGRPRVGGLRFWGLLLPVAIAVAGGGWAIQNAWLSYTGLTEWREMTDAVPGQGPRNAFSLFLAIAGPGLAVIVAAFLLTLLPALWFLRRFLRHTHYLVTDRAAYIASGARNPRARRYPVGRVRRRKGWITGTDLLFHVPPARMSSRGMYQPAPHGFKRLTPEDEKAAMAAFEPLLARAAEHRAKLLDTLAKGAKR